MNRLEAREESDRGRASQKAANPLIALQEQGQAVWLDFVARGFLRSGGLAKLIAEDGLRGVTSNPAIFEKAIAESNEYDDSLKGSGANGAHSVMELFEGLAIEDIQAAADVLAPVHAATNGTDGFVSLEVSPYLAMDTGATIAEARRLWKQVDRRNLMVKVPGTSAGLPAIRDLTAEGININVTLLFAQDVYEQVAQAYLDGLEALAGRGGNISRIASVASFFVSRIDTAVDKLLDEKIRQANEPEQKSALEKLKGRVAIANAKLAYQRYQRLFSGARWDVLERRGGKAQRLLWASTGTKNKAYSDVLYVEELIGPNTVNTMPPATMDAFRDHGKVRATLEDGVEEARHLLTALDRAGISLAQVTDQLVVEGVQLFADAADKLLGAVAAKRTTWLGARLNQQSLALGRALGEVAKAECERWRAEGKGRRLWQHDASLWTDKTEAQWLGWLDIVDQELRQADAYAAFAADVRQRGFTHAVVLGMGGSSLGPEVLAETFGRKQGFPELLILDSTDPAQVRATERRINLAKSLFMVASKSGSTLEPNAFTDYFFARLKDVIGDDKAGAHFVAVTDPGSSMEKRAKADKFWRIFYGVPSIGGRYSVLSAFGLVPAAASGIDVQRFLQAAQVMVRSCGADVPPAANPGLQLGIAFGCAAAREKRDKVTLVASPKLADFGAWAEQLIAESTGKDGRGLIPIDAEPLGNPPLYGNDRIFVQLRLEADDNARADAALAALEQAGQPVVRIALASPDLLGQEFFRWEIATAVAGAIIGINPFDQPDVEASKIKTRELTSAYEKSGALPAEEPLFKDERFALYTDAANAKALRAAGAGANLESWLRAHLRRLKAGDYAAILAYIERNPQHAEVLQRARIAVRDACKVATCLEFGPRFLHSTGQAYKGGPNSGVFLQITTDDAQDLPVPGQRFSFGIIKAAQARGDFDVLAERGRRALRVHIKDGAQLSSRLLDIEAAIRRALA
ncbi:MAG: bifunctional transaldolase/phosoglucose isomerase [Xanthobacteraceae bacterium]